MAYSFARYTISRPVFFIGFMGSGKTDTAIRVGELSGISVVDVDKIIVKNTQKSISELLSENSVPDFRKIESRALESVADKKQLIATGGGCVESAVSRGILQNGFCVYLTVTADEAYDRIKDFDNRPLLSDFDTAQELLDKRIHLYEQCADITVNSSRKTVDSVAREVLSELRRASVIKG